jgi:hypothetical protein
MTVGLDANIDVEIMSETLQIEWRIETGRWVRIWSMSFPSLGVLLARFHFEEIFNNGKLVEVVLNGSIERRPLEKMATWIRQGFELRGREVHARRECGRMVRP